MRKIKLILILVFAFSIINIDKVKALTSEKQILEFVGVRQGDKIIPADESGNVHINTNDFFYVEYKINNIDNVIKDDTLYYFNGWLHNKTYYGRELKENNHFSFLYRWFDKNSNTKSAGATIYECKSEEECQPYIYNLPTIDSLEITLHFDFYDDLNITESILKITEISQGNKVLTPEKMNEWEYKIDANYTEELVYKLKGENFAEEVEYTVKFSDMDKYIYKGKELNEGVEVHLSQDEIKRMTSNYELNIGVAIEIKNFYDYQIHNGDPEESVYVKLQKDEELKSFETKLQYKNYKDEEIEFRSEDQNSFTDKYSVNPKYHDKDNELVVFLKGTDYLNQDYDIELIITDNFNQKLYSKRITLNGLTINEGYEILLDNFTMEYPESYGADYSFYKVKVKIGNTTRNIDCYYGYNVSIISSLTYPNNRGALSDGVFRTTDYLRTFFYIINKNTFEANDRMYMTYIGKKFENTIIYDYELYYREDNPDTTVGTLVTKGKVSGLRLNTKGLQLEVENYLGDAYIEYVLAIKKDGRIIQIDLSRVEMSQESSFANLEIESRGKNIYLEVSNNKYIATKNSPLIVTLNGVGFDDEATYQIPLNVKNTKDYYLDDPRYYKEYNFTGYELNNGLAKVVLNHEDFFGYEDITVGFDAFNEDLQGIWYYTFRVTYLESKDLFTRVKDYIVDNTLDLIKNIKEQTTTEKFEENIEMADNGSIEIYDKTGENKVEDYVGTGMIARVNNEYERSILDMDVVVKGDVTGDGKITITDMIKIKRHLEKLKELEGVYELAGDTTDAGTITLEDLINLRLDIANIKELD